jgi:Predicted membrane protein
MEPQSEPAERQAATMQAQQKQHKSHDRGLLLIGLFKLGKSILFFCIGVGAIHLLHKDLGDVVMRVAMALKFDPESRFVGLLLNKVDLIDIHRLKLISLGTFAYSVVALTEGVGLVLEKVWAEYLTLTLTISFLPWELYELARRPNWFRLSLLIINLAVLAYLVWLLRRKKSATASNP